MSNYSKLCRKLGALQSSIDHLMVDTKIDPEDSAEIFDEDSHILLKILVSESHKTIRELYQIVGQ